MPSLGLGRTLVIANPASHSGRGAAAAERVGRFFESYGNATETFDLHLTKEPLDAIKIASQASDKDTVIALGGDGVIHEAVNGLMAIEKDARPRLGIIPMGSGNDFARTLGMTFNNPDAALAELLASATRTIDLGLVSSDLTPEGPVPGSPGTFFMETLSFGLDAAIAIDTTRRRAEGTNTEGSALFLTSSIRIVAAGSSGYPCKAIIDGEDTVELRTLVLTVQNGPTYGGGFRICPSAIPNDGKLDLCFNVKKPSVPRLLFLLALAKLGRHTRSRAVRIRTARTLNVEFSDRSCPCQIDGEELLGNRFDVRIVPHALDVIVPANCRW
ncbi:MAG: diacylglycerol kinase family lipid kinase [Atopobiaceae bacterium]|nr:diacylglycerol kinase family lipid kinase [Atopobiaceae bacterium]